MPYKNRKKQLAYQKKHYQDNKRAYLDRNYKRRKELWEWFYSVTVGIKCRVCGETERVCLDFHHKNPKEKYGAVTTMVNEMRSRERISDEIKKCIVVCSNCHRKYHGGIISLIGA